ncbi:MAG: tRNA (N(6)-L-threonylcarbamoyladenosine(37)-C(2))-methylthiotransferase MtaB [Treponema sp.]|jgi:threonylcarbamoyladenosine tRNA methylthiotransferase MtaB|nr:tRNA (N(6)-L-threonylcarbamoyladenosine(37)-C(2))-methylthiotransferase MtaB [Treponema sp.]
MPSVLIQTLGCKLNQLESEAFSDAFAKAGFSLYNPSNGTSPGIIIINTCTVTSKADQKARRVIRKALRDYPNSAVLVTGCYAQLDYSKICELDSVSDERRLFALRGAEKENILDLPRYLGEKKDIRGALKLLCGDGEQKAESVERTAGKFQFNPEHFSEHTRGFLKIQDGCDKHCTYCRIRLARGQSVSLDAEQVLSRLRILEENYSEAVLTGVNISQYRDDVRAFDLGELLKFLLDGTSKINLRLSSLAPEIINERFAQIMTNKRIRPHFHLSVQSGSEKILEKMGRGYNSETVEKAAVLLRRVKDDPFLACDIIAGFPGETKDEFEKTHNLCRKIGFAWIHVFPYSKRPATPAWSFTGAVHEAEVTERVQILTCLANQGRAEYVKRWLGREVDVLIEKGAYGKSFCRGVSENYLKLLVQRDSKTTKPGTVLRCRICDDIMTDVHKEDHDAAAVCI